MSEAAGAHGDGLYGDPAAAAADFNPFGGDFFFQSQRSPCAGEEAAGGGDGLAACGGYPSFTDYLQGFLDPAAATTTLSGDAHAVKQEMVISGHVDAPVTPNSSSVLSSSSEEAAGGGDGEEPRRRCNKRGRRPEEEQEIDDDHQAHGNSKRSGIKKGEAKKKARAARVAFVTKSEVDHLEDGYRWRKYGQKAVKNSSYPRSYYRCTAPRCGVKKRVERSHHDPSTVITTYEGQHTHPSPVAGLARGSATAGNYSYSSYSSPLLHQLASFGGPPPFRPNARIMGNDYAPAAHGGGLLPPLSGFREHRASSHLAAYAGGVLDLVASSPVGYEQDDLC